MIISRSLSDMEIGNRNGRAGCFPETANRIPRVGLPRFGDFRKDDPGSFQFAPNMTFYPQFVFNLRRSQFVQVMTTPF